MNQSLCAIQSKYLIHDQAGQIIGLNNTFVNCPDTTLLSYLVEVFSTGYFATKHKSILIKVQYALTQANVEFRIIYNEVQYELFI